MASRLLKVRQPSLILPRPPSPSLALPLSVPHPLMAPVHRLQPPKRTIDTELAPDGHRHYSHLFMVYPLTTLNLSIADNYDLATKSIDWWCGRPARSHYEVRPKIVPRAAVRRECHILVPIF